MISQPDAEAQVIRNLMERIDALENALALARGGQAPAAQAQSLRDREILEFLEGSGI